jgi:ABC-type branched-subunit amino acid transport system ATPase component/predicted MFS family arabinose efflux permease
VSDSTGTSGGSADLSSAEEHSSSPPGLTDALLAATAASAAASGAPQEVVLPDDLLPGSQEDPISLKDGVRSWGVKTFSVLLIIVALDNLQSSGLSLLAPNIQSSFHVSSGVIVFVSGIAGAFLVLGILPMGWMADRYRRGPIIAIATLFFGIMVLCTGLAPTIFVFFLVRFGAGISQASTQTVHGTLLADTYPIGLRGRISSAMGIGTGVATAISPLLMGAIASAVGGINGWRWSFYVVSVPILVVGLFALRLAEPPRGQHEKKDVLGEVITDEVPVPPSFEAAIERVMKIKTLKMCLVAFTALGFSIFTAPVLGNLFLKDRYHLDAFHRGLVATVASIGVLCALPFVGRSYDRLYHRDPAKALALIGKLIIPVALIIPIQYFMPNAILYAIFNIFSWSLIMVAFAMVTPVLQSVAPYRLRGLTGAIGAIYMFFIGATGGAILAALLTNSLGPRPTVLIVMIPSAIIGGLLIIRGSHYIHNDLSMVVVELQEELEEHKRQQADPSAIPVLQLNNVDFSYGHVQILFGLGFEVRRGEVLALLGTNGSGKSTALKIAAGLEVPARGVVRLKGQTITYTTPEQRSKLGVHLLPGGKGIFGEMTILENLQMGGFAYRSDKEDLERRIARVFDLFPLLAERKQERADSLSGGQQQMLALGMMLLHDPEILMIDELSLGLAPIVVQELIEVVGRLKSEGMTLIIVEQSLNVAAAIADRAIFLEKGQIRFEGSITDLMERDDLARAVFLGGSTTS